MKYIQKIVILISGLGLLISCQEPDYPAAVPATGPSTVSANILFIQASPDAPALNGLINNLQMGNSISFGQSTSYSAVPVGANQIKANAATGNIGGVIGSGSVLYRSSATNQTNFTFFNGISYTVIVTDTINRPKPTTVGGTNPGGPQFLGPITDVLKAPTAGNSGIRFLNLAAGAPSVYLTASSATLAGTLSTSRSYRATSNTPVTPSISYTSFTSLPIGSYDLEVRTGSATGPIVAQLSGAILADGKLYTIYLSGKVVSSVIKVPYAINTVQHN